MYFSVCLPSISTACNVVLFLFYKGRSRDPAGDKHFTRGPGSGEDRIRAQVSLIPEAMTLAVGWQKLQCAALGNHPLWGLLHGPGVREVDLPPHSPTHVRQEMPPAHMKGSLLQRLVWEPGGTREQA